MDPSLNDGRTVLRAGYHRLLNADSALLERVSGGFSGAVVIRVETGDGIFCLRRWPENGPAADRLVAIHRLLMESSALVRGIIPEPVPCKSGSTLFETTAGRWQLENWLPGVADFRTQPSEARLLSAMRSVAELHQVFREWGPPETTRAWFQPAHEASSPTIAHRIALIREHQDLLGDYDRALLREPDPRFREVSCRMTSLFRVASSTIEEQLQSCTDCVVPIQPCVRDLWHDHLLFMGDELTGIVDFGATAMDSVSCDLSRLLGSIAADDSAMRERALQFYEQIRPLTVNENRLLAPFDHSNVLLSGMTWLKRRYVTGNTPENLVAVCGRIEQIVTRLEQLAASIH